MDYSGLKSLLLEGNPEFWDGLAARTRNAADFGDLFALSTLRKKAHARQFDACFEVIPRLAIRELLRRAPFGKRLGSCLHVCCTEEPVIDS